MTVFSRANNEVVDTGLRGFSSSGAGWGRGVGLGAGVGIGAGMAGMISQAMGSAMTQQQAGQAAGAAGAAAAVPDVMTLAEAAAYLKVSEADVKSLIDEGQVKGKKIGAELRISKKALDDFLAS